jgi:hypothetical protein
MKSNFEEDSRIYEYTSTANPSMTDIPIMYHESLLHEKGNTRIIYFDLSSYIETSYVATSPNLLAGFIRICKDENIKTFANATSQIFYIINGSGNTIINNNIIEWNKGDLFVIPYTDNEIIHNANIDSAIYWVSDEPLLNYFNFT